MDDYVIVHKEWENKDLFNQHQLQTFMHCGKVRGNRIQLAVLLEIEASLCAAAVYMAGGMVRQVLLIVLLLFFFWQIVPFTVWGESCLWASQLSLPGCTSGTRSLQNSNILVNVEWEISVEQTLSQDCWNMHVYGSLYVWRIFLYIVAFCPQWWGEKMMLHDRDTHTLRQTTTRLCVFGVYMCMHAFINVCMYV